MSDTVNTDHSVDRPLSDAAEQLISAVHDSESTEIRVNEDSSIAVWLTIKHRYGGSMTELADTAAELGEIAYLNVWQTERHPGFDVDIRVEL